MTMFAVPSIKVALQANIAAAMPGVAVTYGYPDGTPPDEFLYVGDARSKSRPRTLGKSGKREDTADVKVIIGVTKNGGSQQVATDRAYEIANDVAAYIISDPTIGGTCQYVDDIADELEEFVSSNGSARTSFVTLTITCHALT